MDNGHGYSIGELNGALLSDTKRTSNGPAYLRNYKGVFVDGALEDYRLAKLSILLENPRETLPDLEERVQRRMAALDGDRPQLTDETYSGLSKMAGRYAWTLKERFSSRRLSSLLREGEFEDLVEESVLKALNGIVIYKPTSPFF
ncbi:MAG: hypothetical protein HYT70_01805 [Candidatus Aenigmarchaeota archaeon]|nr:hypothetical protein [Candidatus Aenigmarchaeota archaeon]